MTGLAIGSIKARDEISEVVVVIVVVIKMRMFRLSVMNLSSKTRSFKIVFRTTYILLLVKTKPLGRGSWTHLSLFLFKSHCSGNKPDFKISIF